MDHAESIAPVSQPLAQKKIVRFSQNNFLRLRTGLRSSDFKFFWNRFARTRERDQNVPKNGWFSPQFLAQAEISNFGRIYPSLTAN